jgi:CRISPR/Cas system-associated endonuclease Cas3-HD
MADIHEETQQKIRRSLGMEFVRMEDDFDKTRGMREKLTDKLVAVAEKVKLVNDSGEVNDDTLTGVSVMNLALKALAETEKASVQAITLKLRHQEQETASAAAHEDRIRVVIEATRPGSLKDKTFDSSSLEEKLEEMFDKQIQDFELKTNPSDLTD